MEYEKLGAFYLGAETGAEPLEAPILYDARDLTTHAVCIGMTGSGKTGLCLDLLEEAAMDRVPALIIDPKGDMTNVLLTFPDLAPEDFAPWIDPDEARRNDMEPAAFAAAQAELWRGGLAKWGQDGARVRALRETTDFAIYTPGSEAGLPVSVLSSLDAPDADREEEAEYLREQISGTVSGLLGLIGADADPIQSREHILLSTIFEHRWRAGEDLDLAALIRAIQSPPVRQLGAFDVDTFFPEKERLSLAMRLNNLIASPGFRSWTHGQPLDVPGFLTAEDGRPRHSIFYIAHLSEAERMFFVTLLLNQVITWMRRQPGTTSLRALLYMDEVSGFLPPVAEPPSKRPFMTLLKQARAYGVGVVLSTQNPVDLDYKALTNAGTWFVGRLQTERDKARLLDGLETAGAGGGPSRGDLETRISGLDRREFLLHNVHEEAPLTFRTRWAMSYLRGPLTRDQVARLMEGRKAAGAPGSAAAPPAATDEAAADRAAPDGRDARGAPSGDESLPSVPPALGSEVSQVFLPLTLGETGAALQAESRLGAAAEVVGQSLAYRPALLGTGTVHYLHRASGQQLKEGIALLARVENGAVRWDDAEDLGPAPAVASESPTTDFAFEPLPAAINDARDLKGAAGELSDFLYRTRSVTIRKAAALDAFSGAHETEAEFRLRLAHAARERRDEEVDAIEEAYENRFDRLTERLRKAQSRLAQREGAAAAKKREALVAIGETVLGAFLGRRSSRRASASLRRLGQTSSARARAEEAEDDVEALRDEIAELETELAEKVAGIKDAWDAARLELEDVVVTPRRADVDVDRIAIAWCPVRRVECRVNGVSRMVELPAYGA